MAFIVFFFMALFLGVVGFFSGSSQNGNYQTALAYQKIPHTIDGVYYQYNRNMFYDSGKRQWLPIKTRDCLALRAQPKEKVSIHTTLVQTNGHSCGFSGIATKIGNTLVVKGKDNPDSGLGDDCLLTIDVLPNKFVFHDSNSKCRQNVCGARAGFDKVVVSKKHYSPWTRKRQDEADVCGLLH